ncbi:MAG: MFS transporter TsgA [Pseudomonadales bacterium]|nr:MFS transporter TsgA [Pseudomonadales bacterium]MBO6563719.1 MFS transporter TsgA [Pseudomonadales bacterium]MBO6596777.1 MFS transporter TsgA [Pseudomonadales bacterium]MBO6823234.1 MFS transporter TsgA [Pseudomonadales bacterium]
MNNTHRITLLAFLTYFVMSAMLTPIGIISIPMAEHFGQSVPEVTRQFSWLTGGILVGAVVALMIYDFAGLRQVFLGTYGVMTLALLSLMVLDSLTMVSLSLGIVGTGCGIGLAGAAIVISLTYDENRRASMLVLTDSCFSIAGFVAASFTTFLIARNFGWSTTYQMLALVTVTIIGLAILSLFPRTSTEQAGESSASPWPFPVWLCVISLFLYTLGQYAILFWLPSYAMTALTADEGAAGNLVGQFWLGMFLAQLFAAWWVLKIGVRKLVLIGSITTCIATIPLWTVADISHLTLLALVWGFMNLAMLKAILAFATEMVAIPSPRLVSLMLLGATVGTAVSPAVTSQVVEWTDTRTVLMFGTGCYALLFCLMTSARLLDQSERPPVIGSS